MIFFKIMIAKNLVIIFLTIKNIEINKIILIVIKPPVKLKLFYNISNQLSRKTFRHKSTYSSILILFYTTIKLKTITLATIPTKSAHNAAHNTNLVFFIPTLLVYTAIVYTVVSVDPIITEAIKPILESTP